MRVIRRVVLAAGACLALTTGAAQLALPANARAGSKAVDHTAVYWTDTGGGSGTTIGRTILGGGLIPVIPDFIDQADGPCMMTHGNGHLYWTNYGGNSIGRADMDGGAARRRASLNSS